MAWCCVRNEATRGVSSFYPHVHNTLFTWQRHFIYVLFTSQTFLCDYQFPFVSLCCNFSHQIKSTRVCVSLLQFEFDIFKLLSLKKVSFSLFVCLFVCLAVLCVCQTLSSCFHLSHLCIVKEEIRRGNSSSFELLHPFSTSSSLFSSSDSVTEKLSLFDNVTKNSSS
jgi:hypothetical protein